MSKVLKCPHCGEPIYLPLPDDDTAEPHLRPDFKMPELEKNP